MILMSYCKSNFNDLTIKVSAALKTLKSFPSFTETD